MEYTVKRAHLGDKWYDAGDPREARESDVKHLVKAGVLVPAGEGDDTESTNKPDAPVENKAAAKASNKAAQAPEAKPAE